MFKKISYFLAEYKKQRIKLDDKLSFKNTLKAILSSIAINLFIFLLPVLLVYNLFIFDRLIFLLEMVIIALIIAFTFSYNYFFIQVARNYDERLEKVNFKKLIVIESLIASIFLIILAIVIMAII